MEQMIVLINKNRLTNSLIFIPRGSKRYFIGATTYIKGMYWVVRDMIPMNYGVFQFHVRFHANEFNRKEGRILGIRKFVASMGDLEERVNRELDSIHF